MQLLGGVQQFLRLFKCSEQEWDGFEAVNVEGHLGFALVGEALLAQTDGRGALVYVDDWFSSHCLTLDLTVARIANFISQTLLHFGHLECTEGGSQFLGIVADVLELVWSHVLQF